MQTKKRKFFTLIAVAVLSVLATLLLTTGAKSIETRQEITGAYNHVVTLDQAIKYVDNYAKAPKLSIKGGYFDRSIFDKILAQSGCIGVRFYYGQKDDGSPTIVLVGVDSKNQDLVGGILGEDIIPCPPMCPMISPLNK
jgi:hypothetical protein